MRSTTAPRSILTPNSLASLHIEVQGFSDGSVEQSVGLHT
jgi:hypothetical protein